MKTELVISAVCVFLYLLGTISVQKNRKSKIKFGNYVPYAERNKRIIFNVLSVLGIVSLIVMMYIMFTTEDSVVRSFNIITGLILTGINSLLYIVYLNKINKGY